MAKTHPKLTDLTEILFHQIIQVEKTIKQNAQAQASLIQKLDNVQVKVNVAELRSIEQENRDKLRNDFEQFHREITKNNEELLKVHKAVSSKRLLYLIGLNVFLLLITGFSMFIATKNTIETSECERLTNEKGQLINQLENVNQFFIENPRTAKSFKEWSQKQ